LLERISGKIFIRDIFIVPIAITEKISSFYSRLEAAPTTRG